MRSTFKTVFYVNGSKEKNGIVPIMGRVTINGTIAQFSCKQRISKELWDAKGNKAKGKVRDEIGFFAKFVLCSNNEHLPVIIDAGETRYLVRKIVPLQNDDTDFLQKRKTEIPAFLHFLQYRHLSTGKESRMWLNPKLLETDALRKIIRSNRNRLEIEMAELLLDIMASVGVESVSFCLNDIVLLLVCSQVKVEKS